MTNAAKRSRDERERDVGCTGGMSLFRSWCIVPVLMICSTLSAQPGWRPLKVQFALYNDGLLVDPADLQLKNDYQITVDRHEAPLSRAGETSFTQTEFSWWNSDISNHHDTLWMEITHEHRLMRIGFPPRAGKPGVRYSTRGIRIDLRPGRFMVTDLPKEVTMKGVVRNLDRIAQGNPYFDLMVRSGDHWSYSGVFDRTTGKIEATLTCTTTWDGRTEWVDLALVTQNWLGMLNAEMLIRTPYGPVIDLDTFDLVGSRFRTKQGALTIETALPRDTIIAGSLEAMSLHMHPINPSPIDTLDIELRWGGSGAPYVSSHTLVPRPDGMTELRFSFALRTDVDVACDSWIEHARPFRIPKLPPGRYMLTQEAITGKDIRNLDFLLGREIPFNVEARQ